MESIGGSYDGVFPMGLVGCLKPASHIYKYTRFFKRDVQNPLVLTVSVYDGHLKCEELCHPPNGNAQVKSLASITHNRHYMAPGVQRIPVKYGKVRGCLFVPPGDGPFPGVVDMFGTAGGLLEYRSAQLASRGIASLALAFFAYDDLPKYLEEFDIAYFEEAVQFLLNHKKIAKPNIGAIGVSKGGDLALSLATFIPEVTAAVIINGCNANVGSTLRLHDRILPALQFDISRCEVKGEEMLDVYEMLDDPQDFPDTIIPIEKADAKFLFLVGVADRNWKSEKYADQAAASLQAAGKNNFKVLKYQETGHLLEPPFSPYCYASYHKLAGLPLIWGGLSSKSHLNAQVDAWKAVISFFTSCLITKSLYLKGG